MNLHTIKGTISTSIKRNLLSSQENLNNSIQSNLVSRECQCDEDSFTNPNLKVSIQKRISESPAKKNSSYISKLTFLKPAQPETFIKVKSIITKPLIINKNKSLIAFAKENYRFSQSCMRRTRRIIKGNVFTKQILIKSRPESFY